MNPTQPIRLGVVMDPIGSIKPAKDTTFAMLLGAQAREWRISYIEQADLYLADGEPRARRRALRVRDQPEGWYSLGEAEDGPLTDLDLILMRKDPPFDMEYVASTYILERAEAAGVMVVNRPQSLRDANEKAFTAWFPQCCPPTLITRDRGRIRDFLKAQGTIVVKPLDGMGGAQVFVLEQGDPNTSVVLETLAGDDHRITVAQKYIPEINAGDKRILVVDGEPVPYALARVPAPGESRGNLAAGGTGVGVELTERDHWIVAQVGPTLVEMGLLFVGLDVIGDWLTEINVTSPTCARELDKMYGLDITGDFLDTLAVRLASARGL